MKKKLLIFCIAIISCFILSALVETLIFNFKVISLSENDKSITAISYVPKIENNETTIELNSNGTFINKLLIQYEASNDIEYTLSYTYNGLYDITTSQTTEDVFDDSFNYSITNIGQKVQSLSIKYPATNNLKISDISIDNEFHFNIFRATFIFLALMIIFCLIYFFKTGFTTDKIHLYFATICTLLGSMIIVAQPTATFYSWDDQIHFQRAIDWFGGTINYSNGEYHLSDTNVANSAGKGSINSAEEKYSQNDYLNSDIDNNYTKTIGRVPSFDKISYLPMAIGYNLAKLIHLPFIACFQTGKIFNLLFYVLLMAYAIKTLKTGKRLLSIIALLPSNIFLASEYSYDPAVFAGITIFVVHIINLLLDKHSKFNFKTCLIMICSISYACFAKAIYFPFTPLVLLIPKDRFEKSRQSKLIKTGFIAIALLFLILSFLPSLNGDSQSDSRGNNVSAEKQISLILHHPTDYTSVMNENAVKNFTSKLIGNSNIGSFGYAGVIQNESNSYYILLILLLFVFFTDNSGNQLKIKQRISIIISTLTTIALIWSALYISFSPIASNSIEGVQNRYFLPLLFPLLFSLQSSKIQNKIPPKIYNAIILSTSAVITILLIYLYIFIPYSS